jgi:hypothetical protein
MMRRVSIGLALLALAVPVLAAPADDLPAGWIRAGSHPASYDMGVDPKGSCTGGACAFIKGRGAQPEGFGTLMQMVDAAEYRGQRVRFSAHVKAAGIASWAGLWMRVDGAPVAGSQVPPMLGFDNMNDRPIKGTADWTRHDVVLDVPAAARALAFGILLTGPGQAWMDDLRLEAVGSDVPVTRNSGPDPLSRKPNLSFER